MTNELNEVNREYCNSIDAYNIIKEYMVDLDENIGDIVRPFIHQTVTNNEDNRKQISKELNDILLKFEEITLDFHNSVQDLRKTIKTSHEEVLR